ncbi:hypothetical protein [Pseudosporangium ferrugineum]|uniref:hypothetical protein n=1 Tax=Pseudosporangium ferrugineum TaxID=439699 RepID=UPI000D061FBC|nr:hypothetical protein [Pseudosporangium ferrugineum]
MTVIDATEEDALLPSRNDETTRARVAGLCRNPALPESLVLRLVDHPAADIVSLMYHRRTWSDELFDVLAAHPNVTVRDQLAMSPGATTEQRVRLVDDPDLCVLMTLLEGLWTTSSEPLPAWAYRKLAADPRLKRILHSYSPVGLPAAAAALADAEDEELAAWARTPRGSEPMTADRARSIAADGSVWEKAEIALDPNLPADVLTALMEDQDPTVRKYVTMRPDLTEQQRTEIGYEVSPHNRLPRLPWVIEAVGDQLQSCVSSSHPGIRRSAACSKNLTADQIATLAADDDFPVRLLLCENQHDVPTDLVVRTYLENRGVNRGEVLSNPAIRNADLTGYANSPEWGARALVVLDRQAPPALIERLSRDEHPGVRYWVASDPRLSPDRLLELLNDPETAGAAAANPTLPREIMEAIIDATDPRDPIGSHAPGAGPHAPIAAAS